MSGAKGPSAGAGYGAVARALHWMVAALATVAVSFGWAIASAPHNTPAHERLLLLHRLVGLTILALVVFSALWRWRHPPPPLPPALGRVKTRLARLTHFGLYLVFLVMPLSGYVNAAAAGHAVSLFGLVSVPPLIPVDERLSQLAVAVHLLGQYAIYPLVLLHVLGALYHGAIRRDGVLDRMLPRRRSPGLSR
jgi:cytochrome b561